MKILIVEDHFLVAEALHRILEDAGHDVIGVAANAPEAVRLAGERHPDLALIDVQLAHGTCGIEAARTMRSRYGTPALLVTGNADTARAARDSALGLLEKPYRDQDVLGAICMVGQLLRGETPSGQLDRLELFSRPPDGSKPPP